MAQRPEKTDFHQFFEEFQTSLRQSLVESIQQGVHLGIQQGVQAALAAHNPAYQSGPELQHRNLFDEVDDSVVHEDNPLSGATQNSNRKFQRLLFQKFYNLRQGSRSVDEYATEFYQMLTRIDIHDSEDQLVARFIAGLRLQLQNMLNQFDLVSVSEAHQRALVMEAQTRSNNSSTNWPSRQRVSHNTGQADSADTSQPQQEKDTAATESFCFNCGECHH